MGEVGKCEWQRYPSKCQEPAIVSIKFLPNFDSHIQCPRPANCADISTQKFIPYSRSGDESGWKLHPVFILICIDCYNFFSVALPGCA